MTFCCDEKHQAMLEYTASGYKRGMVLETVYFRQDLRHKLPAVIKQLKTSLEKSHDRTCAVVFFGYRKHLAGLHVPVRELFFFF